MICFLSKKIIHVYPFFLWKRDKELIIDASMLLYWLLEANNIIGLYSVETTLTPRQVL